MKAGAALALAALGLTLAGCVEWRPRPPPPWRPPPVQPPAPAAETRVVKVPVPTPVKCVPDDLGPPPAYPDTDQALRDAGGAADRYQLLAAGRILREERLAKLEQAIRRCRLAAKPPAMP